MQYLFSVIDDTAGLATPSEMAAIDVFNERLQADGHWVFAAGLGAPAAYAVAGNYVRARMSDVQPMELATGMLTTGALVVLPVALLTGMPGTPQVDGLIALIAVGTISTAFAWPMVARCRPNWWCGPPA